MLGEIYATLLQLFLELQPFYHDPNATLRLLREFTSSGRDDILAGQVAQFGRATASRTGGPDCARLIHDLRGGAFQAFALRLQVFGAFPEVSGGMQGIFFLLRDHLKIMRNCVGDLDPVRFTADARKKDHAAALLVEKWSIPEFNAASKPVEVVLDCRYEGAICESCLEFSTLDRIIYNLMNNAAQYTADEKVHFGIFPVPPEQPENIRFVVANAISAPHRALLAATFPESLTDLFQGGFSTGGHGLGTRICADFCAQAYGIDSFDEAKEAGHFGARLLDQFFVVWFHWPIVGH